MDSDHFPVVLCLQVKLGAKPKAAHRLRWDFQQATAAQIDAMNNTITTMLESEIPYQDPTARWGTQSTLYAQPSTPTYQNKPFNLNNHGSHKLHLNLLERRGQLRQQGDLAQVAELNKTIRKAAKLDKRG